MRGYRGIGWVAVAIAFFPMHPATQKTAIGRIWEYRGTTILMEDAEGKQTTWHDALQVTATQDGRTTINRSPTIRFRTMVMRAGEPGSGFIKPDSAVWIRTPGRYTGRLPMSHSLHPAIEMADALNLPNPFTKPLTPGETRRVELPVFSSEGDLSHLRQQVTGMEMVASHTCYRVERTATHPLSIGVGMVLEAYREWLWVDTTDGTLIKYRGQARLAMGMSPGAGPTTVVEEITTTLQQAAVRPIDAQEFAQREQQARLLGEVGHVLDANPFPSKDQAAEFERLQQPLETFRKSYPNSPYRAAYDSLEETFLRNMRILKRDQQQADMTGKAAPDFTLRDLNGKMRSLQELRGHVVLLTFFASWCGPCQEEAPHIEREFWQKWRGQGLVVLGIDGKEEGDTQAKARGFRDSHQLTYSILADTENKMSAAYRVQAIPVNVVIDRDGIVRYVDSGFDPDALNTALRPLLKP